MKILISEDEKKIAQDLQKALVNFGYNVLGIADNPIDTIRKIEELRPDLILMDVDMKGDCSTFELTDYINEVFKLPVVFLAIYPEKLFPKKVLNDYPYGLLVKPYSEKQLYVTIELAYHKYSESMYLL